ncbi:hypothetical protein ACXWTF_12840 [Thiomicrolovo sp. ZZH C-3]
MKQNQPTDIAKILQKKIAGAQTPDEASEAPVNNVVPAAKPAVAQSNGSISVFQNEGNFKIAQRMAYALSTADFTPQRYRGNLSNCLLALEMANRMDASVMAIMQSMFVVKGNPGWSSQFIIASINQSGRFKTTLMYDTDEDGKGNVIACRAYALDRFGNKVDGPKVTLAMARSEGWTKNEKWESMPEVMLRYRAAAFFGRQYVPEMLMGMKTVEELEDIHEVGVADMPPAGTVQHEAPQKQPDQPEMVDAEIAEDVPSAQAEQPEQKTPAASTAAPLELIDYDEEQQESNFPPINTISDLTFALDSIGLAVEVKKGTSGLDWFAGVQVPEDDPLAEALIELKFIFRMGRYVRKVTDLVKAEEQLQQAS